MGVLSQPVPASVPLTGLVLSRLGQDETSEQTMLVLNWHSTWTRDMVIPMEVRSSQQYLDDL
jgi:hypothetical protein